MILMTDGFSRADYSQGIATMPAILMHRFHVDHEAALSLHMEFALPCMYLAQCDWNSGEDPHARRLARGEMEAVFSGSRRLLPNGADLSYHNWATQTSRTNATEGFEAVCDVDTGIMVLRSKHDGVAINVDPACAAGDKSTCMHLEAPQYQQVILYDHIPSPP